MPSKKSKKSKNSKKNKEDTSNTLTNVDDTKTLSELDEIYDSDSELNEISEQIDDEKIEEEYITDEDNDDNDNDTLGDDLEVDDVSDNESSDSDYDDCLYEDAELYEETENAINKLMTDKLTSLIVPKNKRITKPRLTKYERERILGDRANMIQSGAKPMVKNTRNMSPKEIALLELKNNVIPIIIRRGLSNGMIEEWKVSELLH